MVDLFIAQNYPLVYVDCRNRSIDLQPLPLRNKPILPFKQANVATGVARTAVSMWRCAIRTYKQKKIPMKKAFVSTRHFIRVSINCY